jgi:ElaB/YqjD/DUF883 family membrane-anchored ribosome-binding protein
MGDIKTMRNSARNHLAVEEWREKYGIDISHDKRVHDSTYIRINEYIFFSYYKDGKADKEKGSGKYVFWSVDGRQPKDEWLLVISFPTGAYIFGDDYEYQKKLFEDFFKELQSYNSKYNDVVNSTVYYAMDDANKIYREFESVLDKYKDRNKAELKQRKVEKLKKDLEKLIEKD